VTTHVYDLGSSGPAVAEVRARLFRVGLLPDPDGDAYDESVRAAVRQFQQDRRLLVDGVVGPETFRRLEEARWRVGERLLQYRPGHMLRGDDVAALQMRLNELGFDAGRHDGIFGPATDRAVRELQRGTGEESDGIVGPGTLRALERLQRSVRGDGGRRLREAEFRHRLRSGVADKVVVLVAVGARDPLESVTSELNRPIEVAADIVNRTEGRLAAIGTQVLLAPPVMSTAAVRSATAYDRDASDFANSTHAHLVVALSVESDQSPKAQGVAGFYFGSDAGAVSTLGNEAADLILDEICSRTDLVSLHTHPVTWPLLRLTRMPTVRIECGYLSNPGDASRLGDSNFRDAVAEAVATAIVGFFEPDDPEIEA
jgi:N-acetylmuramoyl-L-alanine amidase